MLIETAIERDEAAGAIIVDPADIATAGNVRRPRRSAALRVQGRSQRVSRDARAGGAEVTRRLIAFNDAHRHEEMPYFGQEIFEQAQTARAADRRRNTSTRCAEASAARARKGSTRRWTNTSSMRSSRRRRARRALIDLVNGDSGGGGSSLRPRRWRAIRTSRFRRVRVRIASRHLVLWAAWSEATLMKLAYAFEQATHARVAPKFLATAQLRSSPDA